MDLTTLFVAYVGYKVYDALTGDNKKKQSKKYKKNSSSKSSYRKKGIQIIVMPLRGSMIMVRVYNQT